MKNLESALGGLLAIGWTLDDVLDLTWPQLMFCAGAVMRHKAEFYGMIMESVGGAFGVGATGKKNTKQAKSAPPLDQQLYAAGIQVTKG